MVKHKFSRGTKVTWDEGHTSYDLLFKGYGKGPFTVLAAGSHGFYSLQGVQSLIDEKALRLPAKSKFLPGDIVEFDPKHPNNTGLLFTYGVGPFVVDRTEDSLGRSLLHLIGWIGGFDEEWFITFDEGINLEDIIVEKQYKTITLHISNNRDLPGLVQIENGKPIINSNNGSPFTHQLPVGSYPAVRLKTNPIEDFSSLSKGQKSYLKKSIWLMLKMSSNLVGLPEDVWKNLDGSIYIEEVVSKIPSKKEALEQNKNSLFCARCDQLTIRQPLAFGVIQYCKCTG